MSDKSGKPAKISPWGNDNPEKLKRTPTKSIGWGQQLKGLFNPDAIINQFNGESASDEANKPQNKERKARGNEILVFSRTVKEEERKIYQETSIILQKLKEQVTVLEKSNRGLVTEMAKIKVEQAPQKNGIYYIRYLEWLLVVVRQMRIKVEEGRAWLETFTKRKSKKLGYWKMYKKHGTTFGLSQERSLSTQTG
ncbi:hypothetical protein HY029_00425 [Candidatus Gottesmanbacteria bacterium]|nr:hypothetical protein [Candidatus Gottesmanbacteria bacterium]